MKRFKFQNSSLDGLFVSERYHIGDNRGFLSRLWCKDAYKEIGWNVDDIVQINHTYTAKKGTIRGMHFQKKPFEEKKIVSCIRGSIFDVAIDLRKNSSTYLSWYGLELSSDNKLMLNIPEGFAHGFQALKANSELIYLHSQNWVKKSEAGIRFDDPYLNIKWPLKPKCISSRDLSLPYLKNK